MFWKSYNHYNFNELHSEHICITIEFGNLRKK